MTTHGLRLIRYRKSIYEPSGVQLGWKTACVHALFYQVRKNEIRSCSANISQGRISVFGWYIPGAPITDAPIGNGSSRFVTMDSYVISPTRNVE